ncbi:hypothetical protein LXA43DRAFT_1085781 [Ganoderma leucocontextum]|nr:hypothetical protein LXA43DRAFT_1085781 [Ganoderma leucocontextum]
MANAVRSGNDNGKIRGALKMALVVSLPALVPLLNALHRTPHISVGKSAAVSCEASKVLKQLTGLALANFKARYTVHCRALTISGVKAKNVLERGLKVKEYEWKGQNFSEMGNLGSGIHWQEYIDLGVRHNPMRGIFDMDFYVVMGRPGHWWRGRSRSWRGLASSIGSRRTRWCGVVQAMI